jgi:hypothetical protein
VGEQYVYKKEYENLLLKGEISGKPTQNGVPLNVDNFRFDNEEARKLLDTL